jgi:serine/threonine protein kinase/tetratricopeptide (TPR) repeat protein
MGAVYRVWDEDLGCVVALKTLHDIAPEQMYRLKNEFRSLLGVVHPNLVQLHEMVVTEDLCFFTMEYVDGVDFVQYVRGAQPEPTTAEVLSRFSRAAPQLARGIAAVHAAGRLHRDVKPSNIRVASPDGRVVLLDFDLATPLARDTLTDSFASAAAGTFAYMAPEQTWGGDVGAAADLYALGVVFFEALCGHIPFDGPPTEILLAKASTAPSLRAIVPDVPQWLDQLTAELMRPDAAERPTIQDVLHRLGSPADGDAVAFRADRPLFVGRRRELASLRATFGGEIARAAIVCISGVSGIGKTELVRRHLAEVAADASALVLRGRCRQQESVSYKAFDSIVDGLSRHLLHLGDAEASSLLPRELRALTRLFPVMGRVPAATDGRRSRDEIDSVELRRRGFVALRELLTNLAARRRLVLWIDDLQWSDADSATLIAALLNPPNPPPLLLILSYRSEEVRPPLLEVLEGLARQPSSAALHGIELGPLELGDAEDLASRLSPGAAASLLAAQSGGSPFLLAELARYAGARHDAQLPSQLQIDDVLRSRVGELPASTLKIVELIALTGGPIDRSVLLQAAGQGEAGRPLIAQLEAERLVRATALDERPGIEAYHDRIRETVVANLDAERRVSHHRDLALAFESSERAEPEILAHHFHGAGILPRAADYAVAAADRALESLAFVRAAELYQRARVWDPRDAVWQRVLLTRQGEALSSAARFNEGAQAYLEAAKDAGPLDGFDLRRRGAEQFFAGGHIDEGIGVLDALLPDLAIPYPRTPRSALLGVLKHVLRLLLGGVDRPVGAAPASAEDLIRIDTCYSVGKNLVNSDSTLGVFFSLEALARAFRCDDAVRLGRSLCVVGGSLSVAGGRILVSLGDRMMKRAEAIAAETRAPQLIGTIDVGSGQVAMIKGQWRQALERCHAGVQLLSEQCRGVAFECNIARGNMQRAMEELGEIDDLERSSRELLHAAVATGARYAEVAASQHLSIALLARDDPAGARGLATKAQEVWSRSGFYMQHLYSIRQEAYCDLYEGHAERSHERLSEIWPLLRGSNLLRISLVRVDVFSLRGRLALATIAQRGAADDRLLAAVEGDARRLNREGRKDGQVYGHLLLAGAAAARGARERAGTLLEEAQTIASHADMPLHAACAQYRRGELVGGPDGECLIEEASEHMRRKGVRNPRSWAGLFAPGVWSPL